MRHRIESAQVRSYSDLGVGKVDLSDDHFLNLVPNMRLRVGEVAVRRENIVHDRGHRT